MATNEDLLFVELALKRELVTPEQVDEIHGVQRQLDEMGLAESVADLMVKKGMLSEADAALLSRKVSPKGGGQQIEGYKLVAVLGRGGMGSVYRAVQLSMNRPVALKVLKPSLTKDDQQTARLLREARLTGQLEHPNIVRGLDVGVSNGFHYFAMEYVDGESVKEILEREGPFPEKEALRIVAGVARALKHAHAEGVIHRDVKPANILIAKDGGVKLADYGLAKGPLEDVELTHSGVTVGTPQYISPEQARGPSDVDIRSDLYSLGATLYHLVTGRSPYEGETLAHLIQQVLYEPYAPPRTLRRDLSPNLAYVIDKLMARKPRHRYQSPRELLTDLETIEKGDTVVPTGWQGDFETFHLKKKLRLYVVLAGLVILVGGALSVFMNYRLQVARQKQHETNAHAALGELAQPASTENLESLIAAHRRLLDDFSGTEAAEEAERKLTGLEAEKAWLQRGNDRIRDASDRIAEGEWAAALALLEKLQAALPEEGGDLARDRLTGHLELVRGGREKAIRKSIEDRRDELLKLEVSPREAQRELEKAIETLSRKGYGVDEERTALTEAALLLARLKAVNERTDEYLTAPRKLLGGEAPRDYGRIARSIGDAHEAFGRDAVLVRNLPEVPEQWADALDRDFTSLDQLALELNQAEVAAIREDLEALLDSHQLAEAIALLDQVADRSLEVVAADLRVQESALLAELTYREGSAQEAWEKFLPRYVELLGNRQWPALRAEIEQLAEILLNLEPRPHAARILAAQDFFVRAEALEREFLQAIGGRDLDQGLGFGTFRYPRVYDVAVTADLKRVTFRVSPGDPEKQERLVSDVSVADLRRELAVDSRDAVRTAVLAMLQLGELTREGFDRRVLDSLDDLRNELLALREPPELRPIIEELAEHLDSVRETANQHIAVDENAARIIYGVGLDAYEGQRWQEAFDNFSELLNNPRMRETQFMKVPARLNQVREYRDKALEKLPSVRIQRHYGARVVHLAGDKIRRDYVVALEFDFEEEAELDRFTYTPDRLGIVEDCQPFIGPLPGGGAPVEEALQTEHFLRFLPPVSIPDDWLDRHPLVLASPFVYSEPMSVGFRARWDRPVALVISLCGTNLVVLSDTVHRENGRGVHIWQGLDLARPDAVVPDQLRATWLERNPDVLTAEAAQGLYFRFEPARWYRVRFEKTEKTAALLVDDRRILEVEIGRYAAKGEEIRIQTYTPCDLDDLSLTGMVDNDWYIRNVGGPK